LILDLDRIIAKVEVKIMALNITGIPKTYKFIGAAVALSLAAVPVFVQAQTSSSKAMKRPAASKGKGMQRAEPTTKAPPEPVYVPQAPEPIAPPVPTYTPPPVAQPAYVPPVAAAEPVAKAGGSGWLLAVLGAAAAVGAIVLAAGNNNDDATSPG
jgi:hypothetical protein